MAKLKAGRLAREVADSCLQYYGGMGYMEETPISADGGVTLVAGGIYIEEKRRQVIVPRIEPDGQAVAGGLIIPPGQAAHDAARLMVEHARADVDGIVRDEDPDLGPLRGRLSLVRVELGCEGGRRGGIPGGLVEVTVNSELAGERRGSDHRGRIVLPARLGSRGGGNGCQKEKAQGGGSAHAGSMWVRGERWLSPLTYFTPEWLRGRAASVDIGARYALDWVSQET